MDTYFGYMICWVVLLLATLHDALSQQMVSEDKVFVRMVGDELILECEVNPDGFNVMTNPVIFKKARNNREINSLATLRDPFRNLARYSLTTAGGGNNKYILTIDSLEEADDDTFTCEVKDSNGQVAGKVTYTIIVVEPIESVTLTSTGMEEIEGEKNFLFNSDQPSSVTCDVKGGRPEPKVKIMKGSVDVTDQFEVQPTPVVTEAGENHLEFTSYQTKLTSTSFVPGTAHNGEKLKCVAELNLTKGQKSELGMAGGATEKDSGKIKIRFPPEIKCTEELHAELNEESFDLDCVVRASPQINLEKLIWNFGPENNKTNMTHKMLDPEGRYETYTSVDELSGDITVSLKIKNVDKSDFQVYKLFVSNDLGDESHEIHFFKKTTTKKPVTSKPDPLPIEDGKDDGHVTQFTIFSLIISSVIAIGLL